MIVVGFVEPLRSFCEKLDDRVRMLDESRQTVRAVTHLHITDDDVERAADAIAEAAESPAVASA